MDNFLPKKPMVIFDTDMDTDCDDAGALAIVYEYVKRGKAELLGIITDSVSPYSAACCAALGEFYGIKRPIGTIYATEFPETETNRCVRYRRHSNAMQPQQYNRMLADYVQKRDTDFPSAVEVYRSLLATAPDHSVTIVCVGLLTAVDGLLSSSADDISPLSGRELLMRKAEKIVSMGFPVRHGGNFNWDMDGEASERFLRNCPVPIYVSPQGDDVITGGTLSDRFPAEHLLRRVYEKYTLAPRTGRASWDLIATLYGLDPQHPYLTAVERGKCDYDNALSRSDWIVDGTRKDYEILTTKTAEETAMLLERLMCGDF